MIRSHIRKSQNPFFLKTGGIAVVVSPSLSVLPSHAINSDASLAPQLSYVAGPSHLYGRLAVPIISIPRLLKPLTTRPLALPTACVFDDDRTSLVHYYW